MSNKVYDILKELKEYGINPIVCDPVADVFDVKKFYGIDLVDLSKFKDLDCLIIAVMHKQFRDLSNEQIGEMFGCLNNSKNIIIDVKGARNKKETESLGYKYWRL